MELHEARTRRSRYAGTSTGKRVTLKPRDLRWLQALRDHGPLPSHYLHAFTAFTYQSEKASRIRLADLTHEHNTPHGGPYLTRPLAQRVAVNAVNQPLVYDLADAGWAALGLAPRAIGRATGPWTHQLMVAAVSASVELAALTTPNVRFIAGWRILARSGASLAVDIELVMPPRTTPKRHRLVPDQLFALEYEVNGQRQYRSYLIECDRGTEPIVSENVARKSFLRSYLEYREFVGGGIYKEAYGLKSTLLVLNVLSHASRATAFRQLIGRIAADGNAFMLFRHFEGLGRPTRVPPHLPEPMLRWERAGQPTMSLTTFV